MSLISSQISRLNEWRLPRRPVRDGVQGPFLLKCILADTPAEASEIERHKWDLGLAQFWRYARSAELFKDCEYGQWGVQIFAPAEAVAETEEQLESRPDDFRSTDRVVGSFFGDLDLIVLDATHCSANGCHVLIALALDDRTDWPKAANSFSEFLESLILTQGEKYWERRSFREPN